MAKPKCLVVDCERAQVSRGRCMRCYLRAWKSMRNDDAIEMELIGQGLLLPNKMAMSEDDRREKRRRRERARHAEQTADRPLLRRQQKVCSTDNCQNIQHSRGLCRKCYQRARLANEEVRERKRERSRENYAKAKAEGRAWFQLNREQFNQKKREWRAKNGDKMRQYEKRARQKNKDKINARIRKARQRDRQLLKMVKLQMRLARMATELDVAIKGVS